MGSGNCGRVSQGFDNIPAVVVIAVNVQDLLALDTQDTGGGLEHACKRIDTRGLFLRRTPREYTRSSLEAVSLCVGQVKIKPER
jgi:hypothetical protein